MFVIFVPSNIQTQCALTENLNLTYKTQSRHCSTNAHQRARKKSLPLMASKAEQFEWAPAFSTRPRSHQETAARRRGSNAGSREWLNPTKKPQTNIEWRLASISNWRRSGEVEIDVGGAILSRAGVRVDVSMINWSNKFEGC